MLTADTQLGMEARLRRIRAGSGRQVLPGNRKSLKSDGTFSSTTSLEEIAKTDSVTKTSTTKPPTMMSSATPVSQHTSQIKASSSTADNEASIDGNHRRRPRISKNRLVFLNMQS